MITPGKYNFAFLQNRTLRRSFVWKRNGVAVPLTNFSGRCQFRQSLEASTVDLDLTELNGGFIITPNEGRVTLLATAQQCSLLAIRSYVYDIELTDTLGGDVFSLVEGTATLKRVATR